MKLFFKIEIDLFLIQWSYTYRKIFTNTNVAPTNPAIFIKTMMVLFFVEEFVHCDNVIVLEIKLVVFSFNIVDLWVTIIEVVFL